jgi:hypothetical protein
MDSSISQEDIRRISDILLKSWSLESSSRWLEENPACGQCGVTALVINDIFGGEILKTNILGVWHFYNRIDDNRYDFTVSQFSGMPRYMDVLSSREEAFTDTSEAQYENLKSKVMNHWLER